MTTSDDDRLLADLNAAVAAKDPLPDRLIDGGKAAFSWRTIDAELAMLAFDSSNNEDVLVRSGSATVVRLAFESSGAAIEIEVSADLLVGQVVPPATGVRLQMRSGAEADAVCDAEGQFTLAHPGPGPFRLVVRYPGGDVATEWVNLA